MQMRVYPDQPQQLQFMTQTPQSTTPSPGQPHQQFHPPPAIPRRRGTTTGVHAAHTGSHLPADVRAPPNALSQSLFPAADAAASAAESTTVSDRDAAASATVRHRQLGNGAREGGELEGGGNRRPHLVNVAVASGSYVTGSRHQATVTHIQTQHAT